MKIFLIGLPGSGKTTLSKHVASRLSIPFVDLDEEIEKSEGKTIQEIFAQHGENIFRKKESECLKALVLSKKEFVMATGGGAPCFFDNIEVMNAAGLTIFLDTSIDEIISRLKKSDLRERPLFAGSNEEGVGEKLESLRSARISFYMKAAKVLVKENISAEDILNSIKE